VPSGSSRPSAVLVAVAVVGFVAFGARVEDAAATAGAHVMDAKRLFKAFSLSALVCAVGWKLCLRALGLR
jgi:hypothetical protein